MSIITKILKIFKQYPSSFVEVLVKHHKSHKSQKNNAAAEILIQVVPDDCYFGLMYRLASDARKVGGLQVNLLVTRGMNASIGMSLAATIKRLNIVNYAYMKNWVAPYQVDAERIFWASQVGSLQSLAKIPKAFRIWKSWRNASPLKNRKKVYYQDVRIDDLIIDTYLRYRPRARFNIKDVFVFFLIKDALCQIDKLDKIIGSSECKSYLTSYASYTTHGLPVRVALKNELKVYAFGDLGSFGGELYKQFPYHAFNPNSVTSTQKVSRDKNSGIMLEARKTLQFRFAGGVDPGISYMRHSSYSASDKSIVQENLDGRAIIFLHDFVDSPNIYDNFIFDDFYQWTCETIEILKFAKIPFAIKPHPNQIDESKAVTASLKSRYSEQLWVPPKINNLEIIRGRPRVGITVYGTVSSEFAYFGIPSICCSNHPHELYSFCVTANDRESYRRLLLNVPEIQVSPRQKVHYRREALDYFAARNGLKSIDRKKLNDQYSRYWSTSNNKIKNKPLDSLKELNSLCELSEYKKFIEELKLDV